MVRFLRLFFPFFFLLISVSVSFSDEKPVSPRSRNGKPWRLGVYQGGMYSDYPKILSATIRELMVLGWLETVVIPDEVLADVPSLWAWLSRSARSQYVEFVADAAYNADWDDEKRKTVHAGILSRLAEKKDLDLIIAVGTWAAQDLAGDPIKTPVIGISISDPIASGIITSVEDSGHDHFTTRVDPSRDERQIRIFHDIIKFRNLGVFYEDTQEGRSYAAIDKVEKVAKEEGFRIIREFVSVSNVPVEAAEKSVVDAFHSLCEKSDAIYVPATPSGVTPGTIPLLVNMANRKGIPTFSQSGSHEVAWGFLLSISQAGYKYVGQFNAGNIARILNGAKPRSLNQLFEEPPKIAINMKTAELIGFNPPVGVIVAADEIFEDIQSPK